MAAVPGDGCRVVERFPIEMETIGIFQITGGVLLPALRSFL